jgi:hypothetical protein
MRYKEKKNQRYLATSVFVQKKCQDTKTYRYMGIVLKKKPETGCNKEKKMKLRNRSIF